MVYVISYIIYGIIWGVVCNKVIENKGYNDNWFWWGFFFGIFAFLVAVTKPQNNQHTRELNQVSQVSNLDKIAQESQDQRTLKNGGWRCPVCSKVNPRGLITCECGTRKPNKYEVADKVSKQTRLEDTGWKCYKCGTFNPQNVYICKCGIKKSENKTNLANNQIRTNNNLNINNVEAIKKYKELLDIGAITPDEYNSKKAELLK